MEYQAKIISWTVLVTTGYLKRYMYMYWMLEIWGVCLKSYSNIIHNDRARYFSLKKQKTKICCLSKVDLKY